MNYIAIKTIHFLLSEQNYLIFGLFKVQTHIYIQSLQFTYRIIALIVTRLVL